MKDTNKTPESGKGIVEEMQESNAFKPKMPTEEELREFLAQMEVQHVTQRQKLASMEKQWSEHWKKKQEEHKEQPPSWLMVITHPSSNKINGGVFMTSSEFVEKYKKWLK